MDLALVVPARMHSCRLPGKMMADLGGKPLVYRVAERIVGFNMPYDLIVATDHTDIVEAVKPLGCKVEMTDSNHQSGTDRVAEVAARHSQYTHFINVQGDEPFVQLEHLEAIIGLLQKTAYSIASLCTAITDQADLQNPNIVKLVLNQKKEAMYFSRAAIPFPANNEHRGRYLRHLGMYGFERNTLLRLTALPVSELEQTEKLEQLRWLENGFKIGMAIIKSGTQGIDTEEDLIKARILYNKQTYG